MNTSAHAATDRIAAALAAWWNSLSWDKLPEQTRGAVKAELLDYLGCVIAGRALMGVPPWIRELAARGGRPDAAIAGGGRAPAPMAALINGYYGHVLEYDDTHDEAVLHAGAAAIPATLAMAEYSAVQFPKILLKSLLAGLEVTCRLGVATDINLVDSGWIYTALFGHFGAAAGALRTRRIDPDKLRHALGIAYTLASGNHQSSREGATTKHMQPGFAAHNGVNAAMMAIAGLDGPSQPFTGEDGLIRVYLQEQFNIERALRGLGSDYEVDRLSFKPYPTCRLTHPAANAALLLRAKLGARAREATRLEVQMGPQAWDVVGRPEPSRIVPASKVTAQFSAYWAVAVAWTHGEVAPQHVFSEVPPGQEVRAWLERITCSANSGTEARDVGGCTLRAVGPFGEESVTVEFAKGHPSNPFTAEEVTAKFCANVRAAGWTEVEARGFARYMLTLDQQTSLSRLYAAIARPVQRKNALAAQGT